MIRRVCLFVYVIINWDVPIIIRLLVLIIGKLCCHIDSKVFKKNVQIKIDNLYSQIGSCMLTSKFLPNLRVPNAEVWKQITKIRAKCFNIPTECSSKFFKFHSRSHVAHEIFKRKFQDGGT